MAVPEPITPSVHGRWLAWKPSHVLDPLLPYPPVLPRPLVVLPHHVGVLAHVKLPLGLPPEAVLQLVQPDGLVQHLGGVGGGGLQELDLVRRHRVNERADQLRFRGWSSSMRAGGHTWREKGGGGREGGGRGEEGMTKTERG